MQYDKLGLYIKQRREKENISLNKFSIDNNSAFFNIFKIFFNIKSFFISDIVTSLKPLHKYYTKILVLI